MIPPKPQSRAENVSLWRYVRLFRRDILSAQPARLYRAWMAAFRTPFFQSYLVNQPELVRLLLKERPEDFPKSSRIAEGLRPLLGNSVFLTNGDTWERQRRIIDPAFEGGRIRETFPAMRAAAQCAARRFEEKQEQLVEVEAIASHAAADVIFRTLFSIPIEHDIARQVFEAFRQYQRSQPILNLGAFVPLPSWAPRLFRRDARSKARQIRSLIMTLTDQRQRELKTGSAPDDLATKIMTTPDPLTGQIFDLDEMVDQVAIFFLAGHETSASALAWALYLVAIYPEWQDRIAEEIERADGDHFEMMSQLSVTRDVFREALRLYPPVPMMVRECQKPERFRNRDIQRKSQMVISPWHVHRHERLWHAPDAFDPDRWKTENGQKCLRDAFIPFSAGPRVCPGAGFAMIEGPLLLAHLLRNTRVLPVENRTPVPVAHLTVRSEEGIYLQLTARER
ncbi:MAG: cytochrome P450 [Paracoccaceae bacterium]